MFAKIKIGSILKVKSSNKTFKVISFSPQTIDLEDNMGDKATYNFFQIIQTCEVIRV